MITNLLQVAAYQSLALQLMVGEADQLAQALKLPAPHPVERRHVTDAFIGPSQFGVNGSIELSHLAITFWEGQLHTITRLDLYPPLSMTPAAIANMPRQLAVSREGVHQLATQWLHAISVDVAALEKRHPAKISELSYSAPQSATLRAGSRFSTERNSTRRTATIFEVTWDDGSRKEFESPPVQLTILANTRELMKLRLTERSFLLRPILVITNAPGRSIETNLTRVGQGNSITNRTVTPGDWKYPRWAPPRNLPEEQLPDWMAKFFGGEAAVQTLTQPERVNVYRLKKYNPVLEKRGEMNSVLKDFKTAAEYPVGNGPYPVKLEAAKQLGAIIVDAFSYNWRWRRHHEDPQYLINGVRYGLRVEFIRQTNVVDVVFASDNSALIFYGPAHRTPEMSFEPQKKQVSDLLKQMAR